MNRVPSIPTTYKNAHFRSRLEAKWAAFFDLLGWKWQYEPVDLNGYIPDFVLEGVKSVLVEVKPAMSITELEPFVERMDKLEWNKEILLLGTRPFESTEFNVAGLGMIGYRDPETGKRWWSNTALINEPNGVRWDFCSDLGDFTGRMFGAYDGNPVWMTEDSEQTTITEIAALWAQASNAVRWMPHPPQA